EIKMSIEEQLATYRDRKKRENVQLSPFAAIFSRHKTIYKHPSNEGVATGSTKGPSSMNSEVVYSEAENIPVLAKDKLSAPINNTLPVVDGQEKSPGNFLTRLCTENRFISNTLFLKMILWLILMGLFVELEFGAVFFVISAFYFMYKNMRTKKKDEEAPSAYSVFNPNCERIDGTIDAEQFEKELKYGAVAFNHN
ncbi:unnamed protein product, partial [Owenia fusiformis]